VVETADGNEFRSPVATVTTAMVSLSLGQNRPNPFNPTTVIPYLLANGSTPVRVKLVVLDVSGGVVRTLVDENQSGGPHEVAWDGKDDRGSTVSSGVYFYALDADGQRQTRKLVLLK
jgi:flagellar hook assembly protein FlgD